MISFDESYVTEVYARRVEATKFALHSIIHNYTGLSNVMISTSRNRDGELSCELEEGMIVSYFLGGEKRYYIF